MAKFGTVFGFWGKDFNELCQRCVNSSKRTEFGRPHSCSTGAPPRRCCRLQRSIVSVARSQNRTSEDTKGNETKRRAEAAATTTTTGCLRWKSVVLIRGRYNVWTQLQRRPVGRYTLEAFAFMSTVNFVTVALTVTGRWAKAGEGRGWLRQRLKLRGRGGRESCSRAVFVLVVPKQHGGTRGPSFRNRC